jgi:hypothetical protein
MAQIVSARAANFSAGRAPVIFAKRNRELEAVWERKRSARWHGTPSEVRRGPVYRTD